jgi:hypothetical protein
MFAATANQNFQLRQWTAPLCNFAQVSGEQSLLGERRRQNIGRSDQPGAGPSRRPWKWGEQVRILGPGQSADQAAIVSCKEICLPGALKPDRAERSDLFSGYSSAKWGR